MLVMELSVGPGTLETEGISRHNALAWTLAYSRWAGGGVSFPGTWCTSHGQEETSARKEELCGHGGWQADCGHVRHLSRETQKSGG